MYRNRHRYFDRPLHYEFPYYCPYSYLYHVYLNSNLYDYYYPSIISPYYVNPYFY